MIELYPFQGELIGQARDAVRRGFKSSLLVSPTGSGKTVMFAYLAGRLAANGMRSMVIAHRAELLSQISKTLRKFRVKHGFVAPRVDYHSGPLVHVASVFSLVRRLSKVAVPDYVIVDEAHHAVSGSTWGQVIDHWRAANTGLQIFGVTATPERLSGEGLRDTFAHMILGPTVAELIDQGYLSKYKMFAPAHQLNTRDIHLHAGDFARGEVTAAIGKPKIVGDAIRHYKQHLDGRPCIVFTPSVDSAHFYADQYRQHGYQAAAIDGTSKDRFRLVRDFRDGKLNQLMSCDLISEGFDVPGAFGAQLLRPTESLALYLQQCGRVLRTAPGKDHAIILDHVGNSARHGLPCDERVWTLDGKKRIGRRDPEDIQIRQCKKCGAVMRASATRCVECAFVFAPKPREIETVDGELQEIDKIAERRKARQEQGQADSLDALIEIGRRRNYRNPEKWARKVWEGRQAKLAKQQPRQGGRFAGW